MKPILECCIYNTRTHTHTLTETKNDFSYSRTSDPVFRKPQSAEQQPAVRQQPDVLFRSEEEILKDFEEWLKKVEESVHPQHSTPGLKWETIGEAKPTTGTEINNKKLVEALVGKKEFTNDELEVLQVSDLSYNSYIKVGDSFFKPVARETEELWKQLFASAENTRKSLKIRPVKAHIRSDLGRLRGRMAHLLFKKVTTIFLGLLQPDEAPAPCNVCGGMCEVYELCRELDESAGIKPFEVSGLEWEKTGTTKPTQGRELTNPALAKALASKPEPMFTHEEWIGFGIENLRENDYIKSRPSGLQWEKTGNTKPTQGRAINNPDLARALKHKTEFTRQAWKAKGIEDLQDYDFIESDGAYFKPADVYFKPFNRIAERHTSPLTCSRCGNTGEGDPDGDLQTLLEEFHLALRSDVAFNVMDTDNSHNLSLDELRKGLLQRGTSPDAIAALFRSMDSDANEQISQSEFLFAKLDPIVMKHTQKLLSAKKIHDQWYHMLQLLAVMEEQIPDLVAKLLAAAPKSLVEVLVTYVMGNLLNTSIENSQHHDPRLIFEKMVKGCSHLSDLVKSISSVPFAVSTLIKIHEAFADSDLEHRPGEIICFLRDIFAQQAREKLKITQESGQFIVDLLVNDDDVRSMAQHPDRILSQMLKRLAEGKDKQQLLCIGHESFREILEKWLSSLQHMSGIPFQDEELCNIVSTSLHAFDVELAELLLSMSAKDSSLEESLEEVDMVKALKLSIHLIHSIFNQN